MEKNRLIVALGVLAVLVVATFFAWREPAARDTERTADALPRIDRAQITKMVIHRPGNDPDVQLEKRDDHWFMSQPSQGPADETAVGDALDALSQMRSVSEVARQASSHAELEIDPEHAIHVTLSRGTAQVFDAWVGKNLDSGTAVRLSRGPVVYKVDRSIRFSLSKEPREWRDRTVTHLERDHVRSVEWHNARGHWTFDRNGDTWSGAASNPRIERLDTAKVNQTVTNLLDLRATDFAAAGANAGITATSSKVTFNLDNGAPVTVTLGANVGEGEVYAQRSGSEIVYTIGRSHSSEIDLEPSQFQAPVATDAGAHGSTPDASAAPTAAPSDASIPPEVMEQIRRQLQQGGMPPH